MKKCISILGLLLFSSAHSMVDIASGWIKKETKKQKRKQLTKIEEEKYIFGEPQLLFDVPIKTENKGQTFIINKEFAEYLQDNPDTPIISIATEHLTEEQWNERFHGQGTDGIWESAGIDYHKMPEDTVTHQNEYVINIDENTHSDLQGDIRNASVQTYLNAGKAKIHLIWEEHLDVNVLADPQNRETMLNFIYDLLRDRGYFVFEIFKDTPVKKLQLMYEPFLQAVKDKFGEENVKEYSFNRDVYRAHKELLKKHAITEFFNRPGHWNYSQVPFPVTVEAPIVTLHPEKQPSDLPNHVQENIQKGTYKFNQTTRGVYEDITIDSVEKFQKFDKRTRAVTKIHPLLAKYPENIIVAQKKVKKEEPQFLKEKRPIIKRKKKVTRWDTIKQYFTTRNALKTIGVISVPILLYLFYRKYQKK